MLLSFTFPCQLILAAKLITDASDATSPDGEYVGAFLTADSNSSDNAQMVLPAVVFSCCPNDVIQLSIT